MIAGFVADLAATLRLLSEDDESDARLALEAIADTGDTLLLPASALTQALIVAEPTAERVMWLYGFGATEVADHTGQESFRVAAQSRFAARPNDVPLHQAHTAYLAASRGWPVLTADRAGWMGYDHLELVQI